jgi:hypothetical protein
MIIDIQNDFVLGEKKTEGGGGGSIRNHSATGYPLPFLHHPPVF